MLNSLNSLRSIYTPLVGKCNFDTFSGSPEKKHFQ